MIVLMTGTCILVFVMPVLHHLKVCKYLRRKEPEKSSRFRGFAAWTTSSKYFTELYKKRDIADPELARLVNNMRNLKILMYLWIFVGFFILCLLALFKQFLDALGSVSF